MDSPDKLTEEAIIRRLREQHPDLNEEDFRPHNISDSDNLPPAEAKGKMDEDQPRGSAGNL
jgi:hypothetical protein